MKSEFINKLRFLLILRSFVFHSIKKLIIILEISMNVLMLKHAFIHFLNSQKPLLKFNQIGVIVGKRLVKHSEKEGIA